MTTTRQTPPENGRHGGAVEKTAAPIQPAARHRWLARHNITLLRVSMGAVIFGFGVLKYFPHVSPAENLILATIEPLTLGLIPGRVIMVVLATVECIIGLSLMIGRGLRMIRYLSTFAVMRRRGPRLAGLPGFLRLLLVGGMWGEIGLR